jgi:hypothetical protein
MFASSYKNNGQYYMDGKLDMHLNTLLKNDLS